MINLELMRKRFEWQGGIHQEDRMIKDKQRTLHRALLYSYQAASIEMVQRNTEVLEIDPSGIDADMRVYGEVRALINPDKVKQDYDDKIVSIDYEHGYEPGDVFEWKKTNTYCMLMKSTVLVKMFLTQSCLCFLQVNSMNIVYPKARGLCLL